MGLVAVVVVVVVVEGKPTYEKEIVNQSHHGDILNDRLDEPRLHPCCIDVNLDNYVVFWPCDLAHDS